MDKVLSAAILGGIGGLTRSIVGLLKAMSKKEKLILNYWIITIVSAIIVGIFVGVLFDYDYRLSLLAGYAGTDILESVYKSFKVQKIYSPPK